MRLIPLSNGLFAKVDDHHFERIAQFSSWHFSNGYAFTSVWVEGKQKTLYMHHVVKPLGDSKLYLDHVDGDGLNNQEDNLRHVTSIQHARNRRRNGNNTSGIKGISWNDQKGLWHVYIWVNYKRVRSKYFRELSEAVVARAKWEKEFFGEHNCGDQERPYTMGTSRSTLSGSLSKLEDEFSEDKPTDFLSEFF